MPDVPQYPIFGFPFVIPGAIPQNLDIERTLYCVACDCSLFARLGAVCWLCEGPTTSIKPIPPWPSSMTGPRMRPEEEDDEAAA